MAIQPKQALEQTRAALAELFPGKEFVIEPFDPMATPKDTIVFFAKVKGVQESYICKTGLQTEWMVEKLQVQADAQTRAFEAMTIPGFDVPRVIGFHKEATCLVQEHIRGVRLSDIIREGPEDEARKAIRKVGQWLAVFHASSGNEMPFDAKPHVDWLASLDVSDWPNSGPLDDGKNLGAVLGARANGKKCRYAITHKDCHTGQFVLRRNGDVYGFDFVGTAEDVALRDFFHLQLHASYRESGRGDFDVTNLQNAFAKGYGSKSSHPDVVQFWEVYMRTLLLYEYRVKHDPDAKKPRTIAMMAGLSELLDRINA